MSDETTRNDTGHESPAVPPTPPRPPVPEPRVEAPAPSRELPPPQSYDPRMTPSPGPSPTLAVVLSIVPSLGHLYLGAYQRAVIIVTVLALNFYLPLPIGFKIFIPFFVWFWAMFDAHRIAQEQQRGAAEEAKGPPAPRSRAQSTLVLGIFLTVAGGLILVDNLYSLYWLRRLLRDWWPAILVGVGLYLIAAALWERSRRGSNEPEPWGEAEDREL